jgi:phage host-nuclease inhibitor protein Gam
MTTTKKCTGCGMVLEATTSYFYRNRSKRDGLSEYCKDCSRRYQKTYYQKNLDGCRKLRKDCQREVRRFDNALRNSRRHAIEREWTACAATAEEIEQAFTGKCHICGVHESELTKRLHMDHDHETGAFRGWLCWRCNSLLGSAADSQDILRLASNYLSRTQQTVSDYSI